VLFEQKLIVMNLESEFVDRVVAPCESNPLGGAAVVAEVEGTLEKGNPKKRKEVSKEDKSEQNRNNYKRRLEKARLERAQEIVKLELEQCRRGDILKVFVRNELLFELQKSSGVFELKNASDKVFRMDLVNALANIVKVVDSKIIVKILVCDSSYKMGKTNECSKHFGDSYVEQLTSSPCVSSEIQMGEWFGSNGYGPMYIGSSHLKFSIHFICMEDISYSFESIGEWHGWFKVEKKRRGPILLSRVIAMMGMIREIHGKGVIHGDMHSYNVFFSNDMYASSSVKLIDFGRSVDLNVCVSEYGWSSGHVVLAKYLDALAFLRTLWKYVLNRINLFEKSVLGGDSSISPHVEDTERVILELVVDVTGVIFDYCNSTFNIDEGAEVLDDSTSAYKHIKKLQVEMQISSDNDVTCNSALVGFGAYLTSRRVMFEKYIRIWKRYGGDHKERCVEDLFPIGTSKHVGWLQLVTRRW
jgi:hypothetical protein